jgi:hypothetical protein
MLNGRNLIRVCFQFVVSTTDQGGSTSRRMKRTRLLRRIRARMTTLRGRVDSIAVIIIVMWMGRRSVTDVESTRGAREMTGMRMNGCHLVRERGKPSEIGPGCDCYHRFDDSVARFYCQGRQVVFPCAAAQMRGSGVQPYLSSQNRVRYSRANSPAFLHSPQPFRRPQPPTFIIRILSQLAGLGSLHNPPTSCLSSTTVWLFLSPHHVLRRRRYQ